MAWLVPARGSAPAALSPRGQQMALQASPWRPEGGSAAGRRRREPAEVAPSSPPPAAPPDRGATGREEGARRMPPGQASPSAAPPGPPGNMGVLRAGLCPGLTQDTVGQLRTRGIRTGDRVRATQLGPTRTGRVPHRLTREGPSPPRSVPHLSGEAGRREEGHPSLPGRAEPYPGAGRLAGPRVSVLLPRPPGTSCPEVEPSLRCR